MNSDAGREFLQLSPLFRAPGTGLTLDVLGVTHSYKAMASDIGRQFSVWELIVPPGHGAPAHPSSPLTVWPRTTTWLSIWWRRHGRASPSGAAARWNWCITFGNRDRVLPAVGCR